MLGQLRRLLVVDESSECARVSKTVTVSTVGSAVGLIVSGFALFDRLTPTLSGFTDFRFRITAGLAMTLAAAFWLAWIATATHLCPGRLDGSQLRHFSYTRQQRRIAALAMVPTLLAIGLSAYSLKYLSGFDGAVQGRLIGSFGMPLEGATISAVNLDNKPVTSSAEVSDSSGLFVLDLTSRLGRPAILLIRHETCVAKIAFPEVLIQQLEVSHENRTDSTAIPDIRVDCGLP